MCDVLFEEADLWVERERTAREEHRCSECRLLISPGGRYVRTFSLYDGQVGEYATHPECLELLKHVSFVTCEQEHYSPRLQLLRDRVAEHLEDPQVVSLYRRCVRARMADGTWRKQSP
jgi:hypothetical protein